MGFCPGVTIEATVHIIAVWLAATADQLKLEANHRISAWEPGKVCGFLQGILSEFIKFVSND
jgi:hypothetical protein